MAEIQESEGWSRIQACLKEAEAMMRLMGTHRGSVSDRDKAHAERWIAFAGTTGRLRHAVTEHAFAKIGLSIPDTLQ